MKTNLAIQLLPMKSSTDAYAVVDRAIEAIAASGVKYEVCPFETVLEGEYEELMQVVARVQEVAFEAGAESILVNLKIQRARERDVSIEDKMHKYRK